MIVAFRWRRVEIREEVSLARDPVRPKLFHPPGPHKTTEFLALSDTRDLSMAKSGLLAAIDNAVKSPIRNGQAGRFINTPEDAVTYKP